MFQQQVCDILRIKEDELDKLMALLPATKNKPKRVMFNESISELKNFSMFLSSFEKENIIKLSRNISGEVLDKISKIYFLLLNTL